MKKGFTLIELLAVIIILAIVVLIATPIVLDVVEDARVSAAKSEAAMIVSGINGYCAAAEMKAQLDNTVSICSDGVTKEEVALMVDLGNAKIIEIVYGNISTGEVAMVAYTGSARVSNNENSGRVTYLKVESNGKTVEYDGTSYEIVEISAESPQIFYANADPTKEQTKLYTNYLDALAGEKVGLSQGWNANVILKMQGDQLSVCMYRNEKLACFREDNFAEESLHIQQAFNSETDYCQVTDEAVNCIGETLYCGVYADGSVDCMDKVASKRCMITVDKWVVCS